MMVVDHLFNNHEYLQGDYKPLIFIGKYPLSFYFGLFGSLCVPIYLFVSGYGLYHSYVRDKKGYVSKMPKRILKLFVIYWISLIIFPIILGLSLAKPGFPGSWSKFLLAFSGITPTYNGTLWFFTTYIFLVLLSPIIINLVTRFNRYIVIAILLILYTVAFSYRVYLKIDFKDPISEWFGYNFSKLLMSLLCFSMGIMANKYKWYSIYYGICSRWKINNVHLIAGVIILFITKGVLTSVIFTPFVAIPFIFLINSIKMPIVIENGLQHLIHHSTNIWLNHYYLCPIFFKDFFYGFKNPLLIFIVLFSATLILSKVINVIRNPLLKLLKLN